MGKVWTMLITKQCGGRNCWPNSVTSGSHVNQSTLKTNRLAKEGTTHHLLVYWQWHPKFLVTGMPILSSLCIFLSAVGPMFSLAQQLSSIYLLFPFFFSSFGINNNIATILGKKNWTTSTSEISTLTLSLPCLCTLSMYQNDAWKCVSYGLFSFIFNWNYISDSLECKNFEHYA